MRWFKVVGMVTILCFITGNVFADWEDSFAGGTFDLPSWSFHSYPGIPGLTQFKGTILAGPEDNHYLSLDEVIPVSSGGAAFGMAFGSNEDFTDVRFGAIVNVTGDASHNYHGFGVRANYVISDGSSTPVPGMVASAYVMHVDWDNGPANLEINIEKVYNNDASDVHRDYFETRVPGLDNARSFYAALDVIGSNPAYITGYLYQFPGGPLVAQTETMIDTDEQDPWEDPGEHVGVYKQGKSGLFGQNEQDNPPGFHVTYDNIVSKSWGAVATLPHPNPGARDVSIRPQFSWIEADLSNGRKLWFGPKGNLSELDPPVTTTYDPGQLQPNTTYQWRIDQVGFGGTVKGNTWEFTTGQCLVVEDFEAYGSHEAIETAWVHNIPPNPDTGYPYHYAFLETDKKSQGAKGMRFEFQNQYEPYLTEATITFAEPQDWTITANPCLTLDFRGEDDNVPQRFYVRLEDDAGVQATVSHPFEYAIQSESWRNWDPIALTEFAGVNANAVTKLTIGVGDGADSGQVSEKRDRIYLDNIRICPCP